MENCGKCNLGPDHPQEEIYEEFKHGVAVRDLKDHMNLDAKDWVLGKEYSQAPDYAHWHGVYEVAERFYQELIPAAREIAAHADESGRKDEPEAVRKVIDEILAGPEHTVSARQCLDGQPTWGQPTSVNRGQGVGVLFFVSRLQNLVTDAGIFRHV